MLIHKKNGTQHPDPCLFEMLRNLFCKRRIRKNTRIQISRHMAEHVRKRIQLCRTSLTALYHLIIPHQNPFCLLESLQ